MREIVFFLEEPSVEEMLKGVLPRLLPDDMLPRYIVFEGKQDLERQLVRRIRGYKTPTARFVVLRDKDAGDCKAIKAKLVAKCEDAGKAKTLVRIACHELESWYLADLNAVEKGLDLQNLSRHQKKAPYRDPDQTPSPITALRSIAPSYQKIAGSRRIGPHLDLDNQRSRSFHHFVCGIRRLLGDAH